MHMINKLMVGVALAASVAAGSAHAATLSGDLTADNAFFAYISTSSSSLGTLLTNGNALGTTFNFTSNPLANQTYYLNIEAINYGGPGGFIGSFTLTGPNFQFADGGQTLSTDTTNWSGTYNNGNSDPTASQSWVTPTGGVAQMTYPWGTPSVIASGALWIWPSDSSSAGLSCGNCTVDLQTVITYTGVSATPLPAALPLFASGLGAMGLLGWRRKRKAAAALAAA
jgi:hypothetical protein